MTKLQSLITCLFVFCTLYSAAEALKCYQCTGIDNCQTGECDNGTFCVKTVVTISSKSNVTKGCAGDAVAGCVGSSLAGFGGDLCYCKDKELCNRAPRQQPWLLPMATAVVALLACSVFQKFSK